MFVFPKSFRPLREGPAYIGTIVGQNTSRADAVKNHRHEPSRQSRGDRGPVVVHGPLDRVWPVRLGHLYP
jgi:hypothetical protein